MENRRVHGLLRRLLVTGICASIAAGYLPAASVHAEEVQADNAADVVADWKFSENGVKSGTIAGGDLVIAGHNYARHFSPIKSLTAGEEVYFTDMDGVVTAYQVAEVDTLSPTDVEEMTDSGYPLSLFTCSYGGRSRVAVRCDTIENRKDIY